MQFILNEPDPHSCKIEELYSPKNYVFKTRGLH